MATAGSFWIQGDELRWVGNDGIVRGVTGALVQYNGTTAGSIWVEGYDIRYVDSSMNLRKLTCTSITASTGATAGSMWVDNTDSLVYFIDQFGTSRLLGDRHWYSDHTQHDDCGPDTYDDHTDNGPHTDGYVTNIKVY